MKTQEELFEIAIKAREEQIKTMLSDTFDVIQKKIEEEANEGEFDYVHHCGNIRSSYQDELLSECIEMIKPFEQHGFKVCITDEGNDYLSDIYIYLTWNNEDPRIHFSNFIDYQMIYPQKTLREERFE